MTYLKTFSVFLTAVFFIPQLFAQVLTYSAPANAAPFSVHSEGQIHGLCQKLVERFSRYAGVNNEARTLPWKRALAEAEAGRIDLLCGVYKTAKRQQFLIYDQPFAREYIGLFQSAHKPFLYENWMSLTSGSGASTIGDSWGNELDGFIQEKLQLTLLPELKQALRMLAVNRVDYVIATLYQGMDMRNRMGEKAHHISVAQRELNSAELYLAFSKHSPLSALAPELTTWLSQESVRRQIRGDIQQFEAKLFRAPEQIADVSSADD